MQRFRARSPAERAEACGVAELQCYRRVSYPYQCPPKDHLYYEKAVVNATPRSKTAL